MEVVVTTGAIIRSELQSNRHHQQTNTQFFTGRMPFLTPNHHCQSTEGKKLKLTATQKKYTGCVKSSRPTLTRYHFDKDGSIFKIFFTVKFTKDLQRKMLLK